MKLENSMTFQIFHEPYKLTMFKHLFLKVHFVAVSGSETCKVRLSEIHCIFTSGLLSIFFHSCFLQFSEEKITHKTSNQV